MIEPKEEQNTSREEIEQNLVNVIKYTYSEDLWKPISEDQQAKDGVMAQAMRDMAPSIAAIVSEFLFRELELLERKVRKECDKESSNKCFAHKDAEFSAGRQSAFSQVRELPNPFASENMSQEKINAANQWEQMRSMFLRALQESSN